ncbi:MAG TPA: S8 family serine peptidase [Phycisphaerales bacterium]
MALAGRIVWSLSLVGLASVASAAAPRNVLVRVAPLIDRAAVFADLAIEHESRLVPGLTVARVAERETVDAALARLRATPGVLYAEPDRVLTIASRSQPRTFFAAPAALAGTPSFNLNMVNVPDAWPRYAKGAGVRVAVLDTGLDFGHTGMPAPAASASFVPGQTADDYNFHGTHCAGTIVGKDSIFGSFSVAPDATLLVGKVVCDGGWGALSWLIEGIDWSVAQGASVISMSLSSEETSQALADSCQAAFDAGVVLVAAAGNQSVSTPHYPAAYPSVIAVASVNASAAHSTFSNTGPHISVAAPGENIPSAIPIPSSFVSWSAGSKKASQFTGSFGGSVSAQVIHCGEGLPAQIPPPVSGRIAHIRRSNTLTFAEQFDNATIMGAVGVIISNNAPDSLIQDSLSPFFLTVPCVLISQADGDALLAVTSETITIGQGYSGHFYGALTGTSQATPHVAGVATLIRAAFAPEVIEPRAVRFAIEQTATDIDAPGFDDSTGHGLLNAQAAADYFAGRIRCRGDLTLDQQVDDSDFSLFAIAYDELLSPAGTYTGGDLTGDGVCDDLDFQQFVQYYDTLLCP